MSIKDLFNKEFKSFQAPVDNIKSASVGVESGEYLQEKMIQKERFSPPLDFSTASNFAKFGSAELYYEYAFKRIYDQYPYDGTLAEKEKFNNAKFRADMSTIKHFSERDYMDALSYIGILPE